MTLYIAIIMQLSYYIQAIFECLHVYACMNNIIQGTNYEYHAHSQAKPRGSKDSLLDATLKLPLRFVFPLVLNIYS